MTPFSKNGNNSHTIDCPACQQRFSKQMPKPIIQNLPNYSSAIATHEDTVKCPKCGQAFIWLIEGCKLAWGAQPISEEQRRQIEGSDIIQIRP